MVRVPRLVVAAPASGHGKTTVATGLLAALAGRGLTVSGHKVGPDYIDPGYHALAAGRPGRNLDPWLVGARRVAPLFLHGALRPKPADVAIVEGVTGLFDGVCGTGIEGARGTWGAGGAGGYASTAHVAALLRAPIVLVVDARGQGRSVAALVHGFSSFDPAVRLGGVVLNRVGSERHEAELRAALARGPSGGSGVPVLGALRRDDRLATPSRHLGLVPAAERAAAARETVDLLAAAVADGVDLDAVVRLARSAPPLPGAAWDPAAGGRRERRDWGGRGAGPPRVALAGGRAFTFGYPETGELLAAAGAEVVPLDPLVDEDLPEDTRALVIGGGFPEMYAAGLSENRPLREAVAALARGGAPVVAECAGLLYLGRALDGLPMCGVLPVRARMTDRLTLGYRDAVAVSDSVVGPGGTRVRGHEFHRTVTTPAAGLRPAWEWSAASAKARHRDGFVLGGVHASYLHLHWAGQPWFARRVVAAAAEAGVMG